MAPDLIAAFASVATAVIALITAAIILWQIGEVRRATNATSFKAAYDILQKESNREDRGFVMTVLKEKPFAEWTDEEKRRAKRVCQTYDSIGIMCRHGYVPVVAIADSWGDSLRKTWRILAPLVMAYRVERNSNEFWDDYEWLACKAEKFKKHVYHEHA